MQLRVQFSWQAGVCLWADDAEARARWTSAVAFDDVPLPPALVRAGKSLLQRFDASLDPDDPGGPSRWSAGDRSQFADDAARWARDVAAALVPAGITVVFRSDAASAP